MIMVAVRCLHHTIHASPRHVEDAFAKRMFTYIVCIPTSAGCITEHGPLGHACSIVQLPLSLFRALTYMGMVVARRGKRLLLAARIRSRWDHGKDVGGRSLTIAS